MLHAPRRHRDRGAAIVEFAIVIPLLLALLFGVVDYGLWFNDSLSVRQGVAEVVRTASVRGSFSGCSGSGMGQVACGARKAMVTSGGTAYAKVFSTGDLWSRGGEVVVCGMVDAKSFTGFVPLPASGVIRSRASMSIENVNPYPTDTAYEDSPPPGGDWSWCTS